MAAVTWLGRSLLALGVLVPLLQVNVVANSPTVPRTALLIATLLPLGAWWAWRHVTARSLRFTPVWAWLVGTTFFFIATTMGCRDRPAAMGAAWETAALCTLTWLVKDWLQCEKRAVNWIVQTSLLAAVPVLLLGLYQNAGGSLSAFPQTFGPAGTFGNKNVFAAWLEPLFFLSLLPLLLERHRTRRWGWALLASLVVACLLATKSRGAWLATATALVLLLLALGKEIRNQRVFRAHVCRAPTARILFVVVGLGIGGAWLSDQLGHRELQRNAVVEGASASASTRGSFYANSFVAWKAKPWGWGLGGFRTAFCEYANQAKLIPSSDYNLFTQPWEAHSDWVQMLLEVGPVGVSAFLIFLYLLFSRVIRYDGPLTERVTVWVIGAAVGVTLIHALVDFPLHRPGAAMLWWQNVGILLGITTVSQEARSFAWLARVRMIFAITFSLAALAALGFAVSLVRMDRTLWRANQALAARHPKEAFDLLNPEVRSFDGDFLANRTLARAAYAAFMQGELGGLQAQASVERVLRFEPFLPGANVMAATLALIRHDNATAHLCLDRASRSLPREPEIEKLRTRLQQIEAP